MIRSTMSSTSEVELQDQHSRRLSLFIGQILDTVTIDSPIAKNAITVSITTTGTVPTVGKFLCFQEDHKITQTEISSVVLNSGNSYTCGLGIPLDTSYTIAGGCSLQDVDINKNGSVTPVVFKVLPKGSTRWHINRTIITMVLGTAGDDGLFGNLPALTKSMYFRKEDAETSQNLFFVKDNSDFRLEGFDVDYPTRSGGGGSYGMAARVTYNGQDRSGVTIELDGARNEFYSATVQSNLSTIVKFRIKIQGHVVQD